MNMKAELENCAFWTAKAAGGQNVQDFVENETYFEVWIQPDSPMIMMNVVTSFC